MIRRRKHNKNSKIFGNRIISNRISNRIINNRISNRIINKLGKKKKIMKRKMNQKMAIKKKIWSKPKRTFKVRWMCKMGDKRKINRRLEIIEMMMIANYRSIKQPTRSWKVKSNLKSHRNDPHRNSSKNSTNSPQNNPKTNTNNTTPQQNNCNLSRIKPIMISNKDRINRKMIKKMSKMSKTP